MRFADDNPKIHKEYQFTLRERVPTLKHCIFFCMAACCLLIISSMLSGSLGTFTLIALVLTVVLSAGLSWSVQEHRDFAYATEFQNALFASALGQNMLFVLFLRKDGTVTYFDRGFNAMYPRYASGTQRSIDRIIEMAQIEQGAAAEIIRTMQSKVSRTFIIELRDSGGMAHKVSLTMDPIHWPEDFVMLRARSFVEQRRD